MRLFSGSASMLILSLSMGMSGCMENIALIGRASIAEGENDVVGEIERVELSSRRIYLRTDRGGGRIMPFSADAQVLERGHEYPMSRLESGDVVAMQVRRDARGESYADLIRVQDNVRERAADQRRGTLAESPPRILTLSGWVDRVDPRGAVIRPQRSTRKAAFCRAFSERSRFRSGAFANPPGRRIRAHRKAVYRPGSV